METFQEIFNNKSAFRLKEDSSLDPNLTDNEIDNVEKLLKDFGWDVEVKFGNRGEIKFFDKKNSRVNNLDISDSTNTKQANPLETNRVSLTCDKIGNQTFIMNYIKDRFKIENIVNNLLKKSLKESTIKEETEVQSVIFQKDKWTTEKAEKWLKDHNFDVPKVHETDDYYRYRQENPSKFDDFRTSTKDNSEGQKGLEAKGIKFVFGIDK